VGQVGLGGVLIVESGQGASLQLAAQSAPAGLRGSLFGSAATEVLAVQQVGLRPLGRWAFLAAIP